MNNLTKKISTFFGVFIYLLVYFLLLLNMEMKKFIHRHIEAVIIISWFLLIGSVTYLVTYYG